MNTLNVPDDMNSNGEMKMIDKYDHIELTPEQVEAKLHEELRKKHYDGLAEGAQSVFSEAPKCSWMTTARPSGRGRRRS